MAEKVSTLAALKQVALRGKTHSDAAISALAALVAQGLEDVQHNGITVTLPAASWSGRAQTITHASLLADSNFYYLVGADADDQTAYSNAGVRANNVTTDGQMTFQCDTAPTVDLTVYILRLEVDTDE